MARKEQMKLRDAIEVLIHHTRSDLAGAGRGIRTLPSDERRMLAEQAIERAQKYIWSLPVATYDDDD